MTLGERQWRGVLLAKLCKAALNQSEIVDERTSLRQFVGTVSRSKNWAHRANTLRSEWRGGEKSESGEKTTPARH
ncbi:unnamed protein product [Toxocara canis]|uniref:DUF772 domain-containing protein n=1 Tax=Toxocara canis TaxID=6265 RepID=A0A183UZI4_TOXCA|nr:unnamed protein product [Toxocara canis]